MTSNRVCAGQWPGYDDENCTETAINTTLTTAASAAASTLASSAANSTSGARVAFTNATNSSLHAVEQCAEWARLTPAMLAIYSVGVVIAGMIALGVLAAATHASCTEENKDNEDDLSRAFPGFRATWSRAIPGFDLGRCCRKKPRFIGCGAPAYGKYDFDRHHAKEDPGCCGRATDRGAGAT